MAPKIILVTGGNRGIGFGIVQSIAKLSPGHTIIIATRKKENAESAIAELKSKVPDATCYALAFDVTHDASIQSAVAEIDGKYGKLDILINNAGIAKIEEGIKDFRSIWSEVLNVNVISVSIVTELFLPLLRKSEDPRVLNISSARASFDRVTNGRNPPAPSAAYSTSKAALNMMMLGMAARNPDVMFYAVSPGHCKTALNGFIGKKDPVDGGMAAAELACAEKGEYRGGFWECEQDGMREVGW